jgi:hypothetical protein
LKTLCQRECELDDKAEKPFQRAKAFAEDAKGYCDPKYATVDLKGIEVKITYKDHTLTVTALAPDKWCIDSCRLGDDDDALDAVLKLLR